MGRAEAVEHTKGEMGGKILPLCYMQMAEMVRCYTNIRALSCRHVRESSIRTRRRVIFEAAYII